MYKKRLLSILLAFSIIVSLFPVSSVKAESIDFNEAKGLAAKEYSRLLGINENDIKSDLSNADKVIFDEYMVFVDKNQKKNYGNKVNGEWEVLGICPVTGEEVPNHLYPPQYDGSDIDTWNWIKMNDDGKKKIKEKTIFKTIDMSAYSTEDYVDNAVKALENEDDNYSSYAVRNIETFRDTLEASMYVAVPATEYSRGVAFMFHELSDGRVLEHQYQVLYIKFTITIVNFMLLST